MERQATGIGYPCRGRNRLSWLPGIRHARQANAVRALGVERLRLISDGTFATEQVTFRKKDLLAIDSLDPFEVTVSWEQLDEWL
jgi:hypothetical protein